MFGGCVAEVLRGAGSVGDRLSPTDQRLVVRQDDPGSTGTGVDQQPGLRTGRPPASLEPASFVPGQDPVDVRRRRRRANRGIAAQASGDRLSTLFQDFDWADGVLHVNIARRVLANLFATRAERDEAGAQAAAGLEPIVEQDLALPRSRWWDKFYADVQARLATRGCE
jgi:hypothetical protein